MLPLCLFSSETRESYSTDEIAPAFFTSGSPPLLGTRAFFLKNTRKLLYGRNPACKFTIGMPPGGLPLVNLRSPGLFSSKTRGSLLMDQIPLVNLRMECLARYRAQIFSECPEPSPVPGASPRAPDGALPPGHSTQIPARGPLAAWEDRMGSQFGP